MAFTDNQKEALKAKLSHRNVKTRDSNGSTIAYVEGWHAIAEANRIFGFDSWDRQTLAPRCVWSEQQRGQTLCFYSTKVRITVRAGATITVREGIGTGLGKSGAPEIAHDVALKAAETDATKRALATFGNPFGLALYDRDQTQVTKPRTKAEKPSTPVLEPLVLNFEGGRADRFGNIRAFIGATMREVERLATVDAIYAFWSANLASFVEVRRRSAEANVDPTDMITNAIKERLRQLVTPPQELIEPPAKLEVNGLAIPKEKRHRDRGHLAFVANQPCLVCGRRPAQAHHLRFAQSRAMSLKVSDEFTVPLCVSHHDSLHRTGDEREWWARNGIVDPLKFAARLWAASRQQRPGDGEEVERTDMKKTTVLQTDKRGPVDGRDGHSEVETELHPD